MTVGVVETSYLTQQLGLQSFHWIEANSLGTAVYLAGMRYLPLDEVLPS